MKIKLITDTCNDTKRDIDNVNEKLQEKAAEKKKQMREELVGLDDDEGGLAEQQEIIDEEELSYLQRMKELKKIYRENYEVLKSTKSEIFYIQ